MDNPWLKAKTDKYAQMRLKMSADIAKPYLKRGSTVWDVGCNDAQLKQYLPQGISYRGIDCRALWPSAIVLDLNRNPLPTFQAKAQVVFALETLEHLINPKAVLQWVLSLVAEDGYCVISLPNEGNLANRIRCFFGIVDPMCFQADKHLHQPTRKQSRQFLFDGGLQILKESVYIYPIESAIGFEWARLVPKRISFAIARLLAFLFPTLFARGFIFLCKIKNMANHPLTRP